MIYLHIQVGYRQRYLCTTANYKIAATNAKPGNFMRFTQWIERHDESKVFIALYIGSSLVLSIAVSLFWLLFAVAVHLCLEWYKQNRIFPSNYVLITLRTLWEVLLDIGLVFFALVLTIYMDVIFGVVGIGAAARASAQGIARSGARFAGWQRALRGILLSLDDAVQVGRSITAKTTVSEKAADRTEITKWGGWLSTWSIKDHICFWFTSGCFILILLSPVLSSHGITEIVQLVRVELKPFP